LRVIVVGADGVIGKALCGQLVRRGHRVIGTTRRAAQSSSDDRLFVDMSASSLPKLPDADVAIICAAMSRFADCRRDPELAHRVNVAARLTLARDVTRSGGRALMLSSSAVFDCSRPHMNADAPTAPRSVYGTLLAEAEAGILDMGGIVLRLTKVISPDGGYLGSCLVALGEGRTIRAFEDHRFCPITLPTVVEGITAVAEQSEDGIFQLSGSEDISYADAARHLADRLGVSRSHVEGVRAADNGIPIDEITPYTSLDTGRLTALTGYRPASPRSVLDDVFRLSNPVAHTH
jgi:dTDP-4-dehydrorhamnose reductase